MRVLLILPVLISVFLDSSALMACPWDPQMTLLWEEAEHRVWVQRSEAMQMVERRVCVEDASRPGKGQAEGWASWRDESPGQMNLEWIFVRPEGRGRGLSRLVFRALLADPSRTDLIHSTLARTNMAAFIDALLRTHPDTVIGWVSNGSANKVRVVQQEVPFDWCEDAVKSTPAYRIRVYEGFSRVVRCEVTPGSEILSFDVVRGQAADVPAF